MSERPNLKDNLSPQDSKSIEILSYASSADWFRPDPENPELIRFYFRGEEGLLAAGTYPQQEFLEAVDYYCENRDFEVNVALALADRQGLVRVFYPNQTEEVAIHILAYNIPPILEFAYKLARKDQKK